MENNHTTESKDQEEKSEKTQNKKIVKRKIKMGRKRKHGRVRAPLESFYLL